MDKLTGMERVMKVVAGEIPDRLPVWASRHNPDGFVADTLERMVEREIEFQKEYDWDMARISPAAAISVLDYGCTFEGNNYLGVPTPVSRPVQSIEDWDKIKYLKPDEGHLGQIAEAIGRLSEYLNGSKINLITVFSPLTLAQKVAGADVVRLTINREPQVLKRVLDIFADTMIDFILHCIEKGGDGLYYCTQTVNYAFISSQEAEEFEKPYSLKILNAVREKLKVTILHLHGDQIIFEHFNDYPIDVLNWADRRTNPPVPLETGLKKFHGTLMGGLNGRDTLVNGSEDDIVNEIKDAYQKLGKPFIVSACCVIPAIGVKSENIHAFRNSVDKIIIQ